MIWAFDTGRRPTRRLAPIAAALLASGAAGCASLPSSGPTADQIFDAQRAANPLGFRIVDIVPGLAEAAVAESAGPALASLAAPGAVDRVGPGDTLQITVFEVGASLFSGGGAGAMSSGLSSSSGLTPPSAAGQNLPLVMVESDGTVTLPYIGRLEVADRTASEIQGLITAGLKGRSQAPQVMVSLHESVSATVVVMGEVKKPGRVPLSRTQDQLLDAVAAGGGLNYPLQDTVVRLSRGGRSAEARLSQVAAGGADDVALLPQDRIELLYRPLTFTAFGALGKVSEIPFQSPEVTLAEAVARAGGPLDQQADPSAVFVFRYSVSNADGVPMPDAQPTAYRLDLTRPESYFLAQRFQMHPHDVVYIANARSDQPAKLLQILNLFFSPAYTAKVVAQ